MVEDTIVQDNESKPSETAAKPGDSEPKAAFSIDILRLIRNAQKQHGLRHGDYQRYRGLCFFMFVCECGEIQSRIRRKSGKCY